MERVSFDNSKNNIFALFLLLHIFLVLPPIYWINVAIPEFFLVLVIFAFVSSSLFVTYTHLVCRFVDYKISICPATDYKLDRYSARNGDNNAITIFLDLIVN